MTAPDPTPDDGPTTPAGADRDQRTGPPADPVLERRAQVARINRLALWVGGGCYALATVLFFVAIATTFTSLLATVLTALLLIGSVLLAPAMVFHYAIRAADRADRENSW